MMRRAKSLGEVLAKAPPPNWVAEMQRHYARTGTYRTEDVRRLLGDPVRSTELRKQIESAAANATAEPDQTRTRS